MTILVAYAPRPEGRAAVEKGIELAQLTNEKLVDRGTKMIMDRLNLDDYNQAKDLLLTHGSVKKAVTAYNGNLE